jgi:phosphopantothenoylcysteine decarboxylase/phosphopantothenate--cysteine ligase
MNNPLHGKRILLGITGSIACYKAADLASKLTQSGAQVDVILTHSATQFVTPLTFQSVTAQLTMAEVFPSPNIARTFPRSFMTITLSL